MATKQPDIEKIISIARKAGDAIMAVYDSDDFDAQAKDDDSPLTKADTAAHEIIEKELQEVSDYLVLSEEGLKDVNGAQVFWLVDPLDGTKEFIKKNGEFTVNIALIENEAPTLGVVHVPARGVTYAGSNSDGAVKIEAGKKAKITAEYKKPKPTVVVSRSHRDENIEKFLEELGDHEEISMGSSLKLCLVAEGEASHYPRLAPTYTWDTAAADAVVRIAGGTVKDTEGNTLSYPPVAQKNPFFIVRAKDIN